MVDDSRPKSGASFVDNPFVVESPERLTFAQIADMFVTQYTDFPTVRQRKHTFIWGSRGSGKSMMLRYMEPLCQAAVCNGFEASIRQHDPFIGVYCPVKEGQINKTELQLPNEQIGAIMTEHLMDLIIARRIVECLRRQIPDEFLVPEELAELAHGIVRLFDRASISSSIREADEGFPRKEHPLVWLAAVLWAELRKVSSYLRATATRRGDAVYEGATSGYHDFLLPVVRLVQGLSGLNRVSLYLLIDDADRLHEPQQRVLNTWVANRDQSLICLKITAQRPLYHTLATRDGFSIEAPHDYSEVNFDGLYTQSKSDYHQKVKGIADKRLKLYAVPSPDINSFLPPDPRQMGLLEELKRQLGDEWDAKQGPGRRSDYVHRYATPRLFQRLQADKQRRSYAGFASMVDISSGIIRDLWCTPKTGHF